MAPLGPRHPLDAQGRAAYRYARGSIRIRILAVGGVIVSLLDPVRVFRCREFRARHFRSSPGHETGHAIRRSIINRIDRIAI